MKSEKKQLDEIMLALRELKNAKGAKEKDAWDKIGIIGQLISGIVLVAAGLYITSSIQKSQQGLEKRISDSQTRSSQQITDSQLKSSKQVSDSQIESSKEIAAAQASTSKDIAAAQAENSMDIAKSQTQSQEFAERLSLDATNRQLASDYLGKLMSASKPYDRAALLNALDVALEPKYSVPLAIHFTRPVQVRADICGGQVKDSADLKEQNAALSRAAISLLERLKPMGVELLNHASQSNYPPDAAIAEAILGRRSRVLFRVSEIDDYAEIYLNNTLIYSYQFGRESGWVDITDRLIAGRENSLAVLVKNSPYEGTGVRFEIQAGAEQFDRMVRRNDWTGEGPAFWILFGISVDPNGNPHLNGDDIQVTGPTGQPHC